MRAFCLATSSREEKGIASRRKSPKPALGLVKGTAGLTKETVSLAKGTVPLLKDASNKWARKAFP